MTAAGQRQGPPSSIFAATHGAYPAFLDDPDAHLRACRDVDTDVFYPAAGANDVVRLAKRICEGCRLRVRCKTWALSRPVDEVYGIWGGMSRKQRAQHHGRRG